MHTHVYPWQMYFGFIIWSLAYRIKDGSECVHIHVCMLTYREIECKNMRMAVSVCTYMYEYIYIYIHTQTEREKI